MASDETNWKCIQIKKLEYEAPVRGGRWGYGGLVDLDGEVKWGGFGGVYGFDKKNSSWRIVADDCGGGATLAVYGKELVAVGSEKGGSVGRTRMRMWRNREWETISHMPVGCRFPSVVSVDGDGLIVMGGEGKDIWHRLSDVQVFDGKTNTWSIGPPLPQPCVAMSAVVHKHTVIVMGGGGMGKSVWCADVRKMKSTENHSAQQPTWRCLPDVPNYRSSVCVLDGIILSIGGKEEESGPTKATKAIYAFHPFERTWKHVADMPFECHYVNTLMISRHELLVIDGSSKMVAVVKAEGLAKLLLDKQDQERLLYEVAMLYRYVETSTITCVILGAAGVGKTHLKHLLLKKDPPNQRISTGLADNAVRAISFQMLNVDAKEEDDWFAVEDDHALLNIIGKTIRSDPVEASSISLVSATIAGNVPLNHSDGSADGDTNQRDEILVLEKELIHRINHPTQDTKTFGRKLIQLIDSGGQFHDIIPLFIQNANANIFVLKLSDKLSHHPVVQYIAPGGKQIGKPYKSPLSHEQIFQDYLGAICSQNPSPYTFIIGTHRDAEQHCTESRDEKNEKLKKMLNPSCFNAIYKGEGLEELIFAVNSKTPQDDDISTAHMLRKKIISLPPSPSEKMPFAWFGLEILLQRSSQAHDGVLSLEECKVHAKRLHIEGGAFDAALEHLVQQNVLLYYPDVLPHIVLCNPQVVLSKITEVVLYQQKLKNDPDEGFPAESELIRFRDCGLFTVELLKKFPKHYSEGLFTPHDLLKLLISRGAVAMISEKEYLMPSLLPHLGVPQFQTNCTSLMIRTTIGCIPGGLFCCLIAQLLAKHWKVCLVRGKPKNLYRNYITFEQKGTPAIITLANKFSHIEVDASGSFVNYMYKGIKDCVISGIDSACSQLKYNGIHPEGAFLCAGERCKLDDPHLAEVMTVSLNHNGASRDEYMWKCSVIGEQSGRLEKHQLQWFQSPQQKTCKEEGPYISSVDGQTRIDIGTLEQELDEVSGEAWYFLGVQLDVPVHVLDDIDSGSSCTHKKHEMLKYWMEHAKGTLETWETLLNSLSILGYETLANSIKSKYRLHLTVEAASQVCSKTSLDLRTLQQALVNFSGDLWQLGTELGILDNKLQNIRCDFTSYKRQTLEILKYWMKNTKASWEALANALSRMEYTDLSRSIESRYLCGSNNDTPGTIHV